MSACNFTDNKADGAGALMKLSVGEINMKISNTHFEKHTATT